MIVGLAINGLYEEALKHFAMMEAEKVKPEHLTFIGILSACGHSGLISEGRRFWSHMIESGIKQSTEHYVCMIDLLCGAGLVDEACTLVKNMTISPNPVIWRTLLVGCKKNGMLGKGELIAEWLLELEPLHAENYILLSSFYASVSQWEKMSLVRMKMKEKRIKPIVRVRDSNSICPGPKTLRCDICGIFVIGRNFDICGGSGGIKLIGLIREPTSDLVREVLHRVVDEEKENALGEHSERLAVAYGLWKTKAPAVIMVVNNLRICGDCHEVMKIVSKINEREIIVRDRFRFHKFVKGSCTCKDYW
ncbi:DYW domain containing protein [Parasponia andersonii]|uniref:DYW domain containing protein n=1 Tax=Parasponia andersonii TaxID=3476 RepID=A0A2P5A7J3_PARAD|nr:DYW domain containing protein [Parasponia andersonii]